MNKKIAICVLLVGLLGGCVGEKEGETKKEARSTQAEAEEGKAVEWKEHKESDQFESLFMFWLGMQMSQGHYDHKLPQQQQHSSPPLSATDGRRTVPVEKWMKPQQPRPKINTTPKINTMPTIRGGRFK